MSTLIGIGNTIYNSSNAGAAAWSPSDLSNLNAWYRSDNVVENGDGISIDSWPDMASGFDVAVVVDNRPTIDESSINGHRGIGFLASNTEALTLTTGTPIPTPSHVFYVVRRDIAVTGVMASSNTAGVNEELMRASAFRLNNGAVLDIANAVTGIYQIVDIFSSGVTGTSELRVNNGTPTVGDGGNKVTANGLIIGKRAGNAAYANMTLAELIISSTQLTSQEETDIFAYFNNRYSI